MLSPPATNIQPLPEYKTTVAKKSRWVLSHYGMVKTCWDVLVLLATIYVAIVVPYNAAFHDPVVCHGEVGSDMHVAGVGTIVNVHKDPNRPAAAPVTAPSSNASSSLFKSNASSSSSSSTPSSTVIIQQQEQQKKASIVMDVIVEAIFIIGTRTTYK